MTEIYKPDTEMHINRLENDAEHSYDLAMTSWYLAGIFTELGLDSNKVIKYALAHDLVEIYAGDSMAIGRTEEEQTTKEIKEAEALKRLKSEWLDFTEMTDYMEKYEKQADKESVFVKALDKLLPLIINLQSKGKTWKHYDMNRRVVVKNKEDKTRISEEIYTLWQELKKIMLSKDEYFNKDQI